MKMFNYNDIPGNDELRIIAVNGEIKIYGNYPYRDLDRKLDLKELKEWFYFNVAPKYYGSREVEKDAIKAAKAMERIIKKKDLLCKWKVGVLIVQGEDPYYFG